MSETPEETRFYTGVAISLLAGVLVFVLVVMLTALHRHTSNVVVPVKQSAPHAVVM